MATRQEAEKRVDSQRQEWSLRIADMQGEGCLLLSTTGRAHTAKDSHPFSLDPSWVAKVHPFCDVSAKIGWQARTGLIALSIRPASSTPFGSDHREWERLVGIISVYYRISQQAARSCDERSSTESDIFSWVSKHTELCIKPRQHHTRYI